MRKDWDFSKNQPTLSTISCEKESILRVIPSGYNTPVKLILPHMLTLKYRSLVDTYDLHFGKSEPKAILLEGVISRNWGSKGHCRIWTKNDD